MKYITWRSNDTTKWGFSGRRWSFIGITAMMTMDPPSLHVWAWVIISFEVELIVAAFHDFNQLSTSNWNILSGSEYSFIYFLGILIFFTERRRCAVWNWLSREDYQQSGVDHACRLCSVDVNNLFNKRIWNLSSLWYF